MSLISLSLKFSSFAKKETSDVREPLKNVFFNLPYMVLTLTLIGLLCLFGFSVGYLLERNYYIVGIFYTHLFMIVCIFVIHIIWMIWEKIVMKKDDDIPEYD